MRLEDLEKGKWYWVTWVDIQTGTIENPKDARPAFRTQPLKFDHIGTYKHRGMKSRYAVFIPIREENDDESQAGWWAMPTGVINRASLRPCNDDWMEQEDWSNDG